MYTYHRNGTQKNILETLAKKGNVMKNLSTMYKFTSALKSRYIYILNFNGFLFRDIVVYQFTK